MSRQHDRRALCLYFAGLALMGGALWGIRDTAFPTKPAPRGWHAKIVRVIDGDTLEASDGQEKKTIRLAGIDAPEKDQPHGPESRDWLARECQGQEVRVVESGRDRYGRTIADAFCGRRWLNKEAVLRGYAHHYTHYDTNAELAAAEADARAAKRGLWADLDSDTPPVPPWEWRKKPTANKGPTE